MYFVMKENITSYTFYVRLLSSGAVVTQTNNISYFIQQFSFRHLDFSGLLYITHLVKSNILPHLVNNIKANKVILLNISEKINIFRK
jgi:hypothetical protein